MEKENLKRKFVTLLMEEDGGLWALKKYMYGHSFSSGGPDQAAWNAASANLARYLSHGSGDPMEFLFAAREFAPQSHKRTESRARELTPHYAEAREAWDAAASAVLSRMPKWQADLLGDFGRSLWRRAHVQPTAEVVDETGMVRLVREDKSDRWYLHYNDSKSSGPYLRTGHLGTANLRIEAVHQRTANEKVEVVSVLVEHRYHPCDRADCHLPAACEIVISPHSFMVWSSWRERVVREQALAPHVWDPWNSRAGVVRLGDVVFTRCDADPGQKLETRPEWLHRVTGIDVFRMPEYWAPGSVMVKSTGEVSHPDRYSVTLDPCLYYQASPCAGETQYYPRGHRGD